MKFANLKNLQKQVGKTKLGQIPAKDFMSTEFSSLQEHSRIISAIELFDRQRLKMIPVLDDQSRLIGVVSDYDLIIQAATCSPQDPIKYRNQDEVHVVNENTPLCEILELMFKQKIPCIPVLNFGKVMVGTVTRCNLLMQMIADS